MKHEVWARSNLTAINLLAHEQSNPIELAQLSGAQVSCYPRDKYILNY